MARKARQRISYVLPLANESGGHRLGVNGLAVDSEHSLLYSGGRDGMICSWDLNLDLTNPIVSEHDAKPPSAPPATAFRQQVQAHTHWINDIALVQGNQALVSASSDITVKLWRPAAADRLPPQTIGLHTDYIKTLAVPSASSDWVASGGLDRKINLWDLNGAGHKLSIDVAGDERGSLSSTEKGSVYALAATDSVIASGGPESTVRVWDTRSGQRVTKLVGHTDNIRDILVSQDGTTIMTASSDRTVKVWSTLAGRCMFTLTMHDASVWSLFSNAPDLSVFYSTDRNGLIVKTDTRNTVELDEGLSVAIAQEHEGVHRVIAAGDYLWTATGRPSINRWRDVNTDDAEIDVPENYAVRGASIQATKVRYPSPPNREEGAVQLQRPRSTSKAKRKIPLKHMLRLSNTASFPTPMLPDPELRASVIERRSSKDAVVPDTIQMQPVRNQPDFSIEGHNGLIKHVMLNDRKRVLTLDTAGDVVMWDLLKCVPIKSFGKRHLEDVRDEVATDTSVANWCRVDTRTGSVAVILEENTCFDAEMYADELELEDGVEYRDDQRINLGKWVLRYLFSELIDEEVRRDEAFRNQLLATHEEKKLQRDNAPMSIQMPANGANGWHQDAPERGVTPKATNGMRPNTPSFAIGLASPGGMDQRPLSKGTAVQPATLAPADEGNAAGKAGSGNDYFTTNRAPSKALTTPGGTNRPAVTPGEGDEATTPTVDGAPAPAASAGGKFGKKFSMRGMSFSGMKKLGRIQTNDKDKPAIAEEEKEVESDSRSSKSAHSRVLDDNFLGTVQRMRYSYEDHIQHQIQGQQAHENGLPVPAIPTVSIPSAITPSQPSDTPVLRIPPNTTILIQEERPEAGGVADLFEGTAGALGQDRDRVSKAAPMWLGEVLLRNQLPLKDIVKISFILEPLTGSSLPSIAADGNNRLNANRMLRAKKILGYVAERIEPGPEEEEIRPRPEEYLELWCQNQIVPPNMSLATIRSSLWRGGGDVYLYYTSNGTREIKNLPAPNIPLSPRPGPAMVATESGTAAVA